ncbi:MAG: hypothetical protein IPP69_11740 [Flavobacteriales bacterium]|nr:hypothetical protein [Flavobacteriales bacterium]
MRTTALACEECRKVSYFKTSDATVLVCPFCGHINVRNGVVPPINKNIPEMMSIIKIGTTFTWNQKSYEVNGRTLFFGENSYLMLWLAVGECDHVYLYESNQDYAVIDTVDTKGLAQSFKSKTVSSSLQLNDKKFYVEYLDKITEIYGEGEIYDHNIEPSKTIVLRLGTLQQEMVLAFVLDKHNATLLKGIYTSPEELKFTSTRTADVWNI